MLAHQSRVPPNCDYSPPPAAYTLFNAEIGVIISGKKRPVTLSFSAENIFNSLTGIISIDSDISVMKQVEI